MDSRSGRKAVLYWLRPITRKRIKELSKELKKPVGMIIEFLVDEAYNKDRSMWKKLKTWIHKGY